MSVPTFHLEGGGGGGGRREEVRCLGKLLKELGMREKTKKFEKTESKK